MVFADGRQFSDARELQKAINDAWEEIHIKTLHDLFDSMSNHVFEVKRQNGGYTKY